jgi:hypothetical protein
MNVLEKVRSLLKDIRAGRGKASEHWSLAERLFMRMTNDLAAIDNAVKNRDIDAAETLLAKIEGRVQAKETAPLPAFTSEELDAAYRSFVKRLKVSRLADESRLGGRYTSGGRTSSIDAMMPPDEFPPLIWQALVRAGKLRDMGGGFYGEVK